MEELIIVGSGPAGYTAALYAARAGRSPLVVEGWMWGGLLQQTTEVENFPGFPQGVMGPELMQRMRDQAERFGARFLSEQADRVELSEAYGGVHKVFVGERELRSRVVVLSTGAEPRKLEVPGEAELSARGISWCATCDAAFFRDKKVAVIGGGDSALEEAIFLARFASQVTLIHRRSEFRASKIMLHRAQELSNLEFLTPYRVARFVGGSSLEAVLLEHSSDGSSLRMEVNGAFIAVGHVPNSQIVADQLESDDNGYLQVERPHTNTARPGVFAAGDLIDPHYRQAITAAGSGCQAALDAERYLEALELD